MKVNHTIDVSKKNGNRFTPAARVSAMTLVKNSLEIATNSHTTGNSRLIGCAK